MLEKLVGIYCFENIIDHKKYVGKSENLEGRYKDHLRKLRRNKDGCVVFNYAWNKYGEDSFIYYIIEYCDVSLLDEREIYYIKELHSHVSEWGYNVFWGGKSSIMTEETKKKISDAHKGMVTYWPSEETKEKCRVGSTGKKLSEESKKKVGDSKRGIPRSEETKRKVSESRKGKYFGENNANSKLTEEDVREIKRMLKDKIFMKDIAKKFNVSEGTISAINTGRAWKNIK